MKDYREPRRPWRWLPRPLRVPLRVLWWLVVIWFLLGYGSGVSGVRYRTNGGSPSAGKYKILLFGSIQVKTVKSDSTGNFRLNLPPGPYTIRRQSSLDLQWERCGKAQQQQVTVRPFKFAKLDFTPDRCPGAPPAKTLQRLRPKNAKPASKPKTTSNSKNKAAKPAKKQTSGSKSVQGK